MPDLNFAIIGAAAVEFAAVPTLVFNLQIDAPSGDSIRSLSLSAQIRIAANQRAYTPDEQAQLVDVFGEPVGWATSLKSLLWTHATTVIPAFVTTTTVELNVPCTYDFDVVSAKYFHALEGGSIPLAFLFSGAVFYLTDTGLQVERISWDKEARFGLPFATWRRAVENVFPNSAWIRLHRDTFDRLAQFRAANALPTWEAALDTLLQPRLVER